ncbi:hypothetical protein [Coleofasciculus sp.]|uniref:hypothetical protein n=1 Tax=Coleofasciculus sp. TaxID=3100458 RepID=UPI003A39183F
MTPSVSQLYPSFHSQSKSRKALCSKPFSQCCFLYTYPDNRKRYRRRWQIADGNTVSCGEVETPPVERLEAV